MPQYVVLVSSLYLSHLKVLYICKAFTLRSVFFYYSSMFLKSLDS